MLKIMLSSTLALTLMACPSAKKAPAPIDAAAGSGSGSGSGSAK